MSRIGKLPIKVPKGITIEINLPKIKVKGPKGELSMDLNKALHIELKDDTLEVSRKGEEKFDKSIHGTMRNLLKNMIEGVEKGFQKKLEIQGVGYRATIQGKKVSLSLGFSHPIEYNSPEGINIVIDPEKKNILTISGIDKCLVGETAAKIRSFKKPEPYKGKGIRYVDEYVQRKVGKAAAGAKEE